MRLKSIKLAGFKSFVDPTTVSFPGNMCAVVGPNGCGKSNVIDAVRWVMGESSAKNLRGESMADVIFNGSVNRQPVGQAFIELVFDNQDGGIGGEYASYAEISIKRLVTRDGQSEYFLNGTRCRRRDITDIFLGTGLGPRSYAIIEQGMISRLIESKPEELRVFIEEAAGISKYKERRRETENRMRRTLENLERLTDIRDELERQLQRLQQQATAAEKYASLREEERQQTAQLQALKWRELDHKLATTTQRIGELEVKLESEHAQHQSVDTRLEQMRVDHAEATEQFNAVQAQFYSLGAEVARVEQSIKHQQERARQLQQDLDQTRQNRQRVASHLEEDQARQQSWQEELGQLAPQMQTLQSAEQGSSTRLEGAEQAMNEWQQRWDDFNKGAAEVRQRVEVEQSRIQHLEQSQQRLQSRSEKLQGELRELPAPGVDAELQQLETKLLAATTALEQREQQAEGLSGRLQQLRDGNAGESRQLDEQRTALQQMRGRQASLEALQQAARDASSSRLDDWLEVQGLKQHPRLLQQLEVPTLWQRAVETVLGDCLQAICVDDTGALAGPLAELTEGVAVVVDAAAPTAVDQSSLAACVGGAGAPAAAGLLGNVLAAEDLNTALAMREQLQPGQSVITPDGLWLGENWLRVARPGDAAGSVLQRQQELDSLVADIAQREERVEALEQAVQASRDGMRDLEQQRQTLQRELQQQGRDNAELNSALSARRARSEQVEIRRGRLGREIDEVAAQFRSEQETLGETRVRLAEAIEQLDTDTRQHEQLLNERDSARVTLDQARQQARQDKDAAHQVAMRHQSLQTQLAAVTEGIDRARQQVSQLDARQQELDASLASNTEPGESQQEELDGLLQQRLAVEAELSTARQQVADIDHAMREAQTQRATLEQKANSTRGELEQQRVSDQGLRVQREAVEQQLSEREHDLQEVLSALPEDAEQSVWQHKLEQLANRIARLGAINLAAIDEFTQQSERKQYLDTQNEDLETALATLESAIRKIDKETRSRFRETFEQVNSGLQELFPRVFGGGSASLEMTGDDLLDTGIAIMARPPGKKNSTIHLLSGGEKALTAIALVFSIFQLNPAPFCMLDEVDAPLDDANVGRYARMVKEMSSKVQFIFITHNKITMEAADQLMGVTMHEPGVSRLVSVDVDEAAELAAS